MKKSKAIIILLCALLVLLGVGYVDLYGVDAEGTASASDISLGPVSYTHLTLPTT